VQCSNCGHTWFQYPAGHPDELHDEIFADDASEETPEAPVEPEATATVPEIEQPWDEPVADQGPAQDRQRQTIDPSVAEILQKEAAFESEQRLSEFGEVGLENQADLGIDDVPEHPVEESKRRMAELRGEDVATVGATSWREMLPDIEEINSTLRSTSDRASREVPATPEIIEQERRSGFRTGFGLVLILAAAAVLVYVYAAEIIGAVPASETALTSYVEAVNNGRIWLDDTMSNLSDRVNAGSSDE
jgi:hypothetical protein